MFGKILSKIIKKMYKAGPHRKNKIILGKNIKYKGFNLIKFEKKAVNNEIIIDQGAELNNVKIRFTGSNSKLYIGKNVKWKGYILIHGDDRFVSIGEGTTCIEVYLMCRDADITIGQYCMLSRGIEIRSTDVHKIYDNKTKERINNPGDVIIKDRVWIAADSTISKGALISEDSVVGAKSFVSKEFEQAGIVLAGIPAKKIKENIHWQR